MDVVKIISHRGNINGPRRELENKPRYINQALELGYDVEIDVWWKEDEFWLGHDEPQFKVNRQFLQNDKVTKDLLGEIIQNEISILSNKDGQQQKPEAEAMNPVLEDLANNIAQLKQIIKNQEK